MRTVSLFSGGVEGRRSFSAQPSRRRQQLGPNEGGAVEARGEFSLRSFYLSESLVKVLWDSRHFTHQEK